MNGALTIGTPDGANIEMREYVGEDKSLSLAIRLIRLKLCDVMAMTRGTSLKKDEELHCGADANRYRCSIRRSRMRYRDVLDSLINFGDYYQVLADYRSYVDCQDAVDELYRTPGSGRQNHAQYCNMGYFVGQNGSGICRPYLAHSKNSRVASIF